MALKKYTYQNLSLKSIRGEEWKDIPGLEDYFLISNFGRVKRLEYEMQYRNGAIYTKPEKIIKPIIVKQFNKFKKDYSSFLTCRVTLNGKRRTLMISRIVYCLFVHPFNLDNYTKVILCKDLDNFNIRPSNLQLVTVSQKQRRTILRKRYRSPFYDLTESDRKKQREAINKTLQKQVTQYSLKGRKIKTYKSIVEAEKATGIFATSIGKVASGGGIIAGDFAWAFGKKAKLDLVALRKERYKAYIKKYGQKVTQYDLSGRKMAKYDSVKEASEASGVHINAINRMLKGEYKSTKGFYWKKGYGKDQIDLSNYKWGRESMASTQSKKVKQYSLDGKYLLTFSSIKAAAKEIKVHLSTLCGALNGRQKTAGGYIWKYA